MNRLAQLLPNDAAETGTHPLGTHWIMAGCSFDAAAIDTKSAARDTCRP